MNELYSIIIPTMWKQMKYLNKMLPVYQRENLVGEILIINNAKIRDVDLHRLAKRYSKIRIVNDGNNLYVNPSWNFGVQVAAHNKVIIANDDIYFEELGKVLETADANLAKGVIIGFGENCYLHKETLPFHVREPEEGYKAHGFGMFMIMQKESYCNIPDEIKIWCGDRLLYYVNKPLLIEGVYIKAEVGGTTRKLDLSEYRRTDSIYWRELKQKIDDQRMEEQQRKIEESILPYNIVLVLRSGGDFTLRDVILLSKHLRNKKRGIRINVYCLTDIAKVEIELEGVLLVPIEHTWRGWWSKMNLFSPKLQHLRPFMFFDLDTAIVGNYGSVLPTNGQTDHFIMLRDFYNNRPASGVMWIPEKNEKVNTIWNTWMKNPEMNMAKFRGDQDFISSVTKPDTYWQDIVKGIVTYKPLKLRHRIKLNGSEKVVCFHGKPRIWQAKNVEWVNQYISVL
jgi:hypothetical protein